MISASSKPEKRLKDQGIQFLYVKGTRLIEGNWGRTTQKMFCLIILKKFKILSLFMSKLATQFRFHIDKLASLTILHKKKHSVRNLCSSQWKRARYFWMDFL